MRNTKRDNTASRFCFGMELIGSKITLIFFEMLSKLNNLHRLLQTISFGSSNFFDLDTMPPIDPNSDLYGIGIEFCFVNSSDGFDFYQNSKSASNSFKE
jgi:hypothetical protein